MKVRDYQQKLIDSLWASLHNHKNVMVQSPAGSGKSITMAEIAKRATGKNNRVLFVVHRRELVNQIRNTFDFWGVDMTICSVDMVQTVTRHLDKIDPPRLILVDEAHHSLAKTYRNIFDKFPKANVVGFTATPWRLSGKGFTDVFEDLILGPKVKWLIDNHYLAPYKYYSVDLFDSQSLKHNSTGDFSAKSLEEASQKVIYGDVVKMYEKYAKNTKAIIYTFSVEFSKIIAEVFNQAGYAAQAVDGKTPKAIREQAMDDFRNNKIKILVNADLYGEGVDVPDCETVIMMRPTESLALFIQQSMRCMRYKEGKQAIILDMVANYTRHGLPDDDRMWTIEDREKKKRNTSGSSGPPIKQCPQCFMVIPGQATICPGCQYAFKPEKTIKIKKDVELEEVTQAFTTNYIVTKRPQDLSTPSELKAYAKAKGYKQGWVWYQMKNRGWLNKKGK
ncbi:DEAD/DEAH box helicase [Ligilactobacillus equi]|uniref:DEAD/DEAH box helicase n=1 Tax=Ligilactobacillus equi TaxID=137357 RepID=UPI002ED4BB45